MKVSYQVRPSFGPRVMRVAGQLASRSLHRGTTGLGNETKNSRADLAGRVQNGESTTLGLMSTKPKTPAMIIRDRDLPWVRR